MDLDSKGGGERKLGVTCGSRAAAAVRAVGQPRGRGGSLRNDVPTRVRNAASRAAEEDKEPAPTPVLRPNLPARGCVTRIAPSSWMPLVVLRRRETPTATPPPGAWVPAALLQLPGLGLYRNPPPGWLRGDRLNFLSPKRQPAWDEGCLALTGLLKLTVKEEETVAGILS